MRVLVTGSRDWNEPERIFTDLDALLDSSGYGEFVVVHGGARGADHHAAMWVQTVVAVFGSAVRQEVHPADWNAHGKSAGILRNVAMVKAGADVCLAYILDGSPGATHCANAAEAAGIPVRRTEVRT